MTFFPLIVNPTPTRHLNDLRTTASKNTGNTVSLSRDVVAKKAYFTYLHQGSPHGQDVNHWLMAEAQAKEC